MIKLRKVQTSCLLQIWDNSFLFRNTSVKSMSTKLNNVLNLIDHKTDLQTNVVNKLLTYENCLEKKIKNLNKV